ncbi:MAG TPA: aryl-sulfate sulfotransferase, partial [Longimicrobiales bacterium]|nr:aryl-sulfate sulfotransferase [Longimicrobiales bacterium]
MSVSVAACESPSDPADPPEIAAVELKAVPAPLVRVLDVRLARPYGASVDYWSSTGPRLRMTAGAEQTRQELVLSRLRPGTTYEYEVRSSGPGGEGPLVHGSFTTDPLPDGIAVLEFKTEGTPSAPLTLLETTAHGAGHRGVVIVDAQGEVVWYWDAGPVAGTARRDNGNFIFHYGGRGVLEVTPTGVVIDQVPQQPLPQRRSHHDAITTPWNTVLFIAYDTREFEGRQVSGEGIWEWNPDTDELTQRW